MMNINNSKILSPMKNTIAAPICERTYLSPTVELLAVEIEAGFALSDNQQEPSTWEDM